MLKSMVLTLSMLFLFTANAMAASGVESSQEMRNALKQSISALRKTDSYWATLQSVINDNSFVKTTSSPLDVASDILELCETEANKLNHFEESSYIEDIDAIACIAEATDILDERILCLSCMRNSLYAESNGDYFSANQYRQEAENHKTTATELRRIFKLNYDC